MRLAIVGAGVSGLTAAYRLSQDHDVVVFETEDRLGGHTHTVAVDTNGTKTAIDTGFIVYNERNYPLFTQLLAELDVATQPSVMSFGIHDEASGIEYAGSSLRTLFAQKRNALKPRYWRLLIEIVRFNRLANALLAQSDDPSRTLQDFLDEHGFSTLFRDLYLVPMASAIWSTGEDRMGEFPLFAFVRFFANHGLIALKGRPAWRVIAGGSSRYIDAMCSKMAPEIRIGAPVTAVRRGAHNVEVAAGANDFEVFDNIVFACHSNQALSILGPKASAAEREILGAIPYTTNSVVLHTDESVLPRARDAWAAWNYWCDARADTRLPAVTYSMNLLQSLPSQEHYLVTLNRDAAIREDKVLRQLSYEHPLFTVAGLAAQQRHAEISGHQRTYYCGAYWGYGFHEDGVRSAERVVAQIRSAESTDA